MRTLVRHIIYTQTKLYCELLDLLHGVACFADGSFCWDAAAGTKATYSGDGVRAIHAQAGCDLVGYGSLTYRLDFTGTGIPFLKRTGLLGILRMPESADLEGNALRVFFVDSKLWLLLLNSTV